MPPTLKSAPLQGEALTVGLDSAGRRLSRHPILQAITHYVMHAMHAGSSTRMRKDQHHLARHSPNMRRRLGAGHQHGSCFDSAPAQAAPAPCNWQHSRRATRSTQLRRQQMASSAPRCAALKSLGCKQHQHWEDGCESDLPLVLHCSTSVRHAAYLRGLLLRAAWHCNQPSAG